MEVSPQQLLNYAKKQQYTIVVNRQDVGPNLISYNVAPKREKDDVVYNNSEFNRINLRRGLTYIQTLKDFKRETIQIARKGLRKFTDLYREFLDEQSTKLGKKIQKQKQAFIDHLEKFKGQFLFHQIEKANGENAQISYSHEYWVISSKNRVMFVQHQQQLLKKDKSLYGLTIQIAKAWFEYLKTLKEQEIAQLKINLEKITLIGQYCDSISHQHIVKYQNIMIKFYAIVQKNSNQQCLPPLQSYQFFKRFHLNTCNIITRQSKTYEILIDELREQLRIINKREVQDAGEGCVIYIVGRSNNKMKTLSLWKVKSVQYRILRKLREKLIAFLKKDRKTDRLFKKYIQQIRQLTTYYKPKNQLEYYIELGRKAFKLIEDGNSAVLRFVTNRFITFLQFLNKKQSKQREDFQKLIQGTPILENQQQINQMQIQEPITEQIKPEIIQPKKQFKKEIIVLVPLTIPSCGKSYSFNLIAKSEKNIYIQILSSDSVRGEVMNEIKQKNKKLSHNELFDKSTKRAKSLFLQRLSNILNKMQNSEHEKCLLILDKNHPQNALPNTIKQIRDAIGKKAKILAMIPDCKQDFERKSKFYYPFSKQYLLSSLVRIKDREYHETLIGDYNKKCNVILGFFNMYRNVRFNQFTLSKHFDHFVKIRMNNEKIDDINPQLDQLLIRVLMSTKPGSFDESPYLGQLVEQLKCLKLKEIEIKQLVEQNRIKIYSLFENYDNLKWK